LSLTDPHDFYGFREEALGGDILAAGWRDVLPQLSVPDIADALRRLPEEDLTLSLRAKLIPVVSLPGLKLFAACGEPAVAIAREDGLKVVAYGEAASFIDAARRAHGPHLLREASFALARRSPELSAFTGLSYAQVTWSAAALAFAATAASVLPAYVSWTLASLLAGLFFLSVIAIRLLCLLPPPHRPRRQPPPLSDAELPCYSILVPLFRETAVLDQLLAALGRLDYPPEKLDIKLIIEETDIPMQRAVAAIPLAAHVEVILVPAGQPQTKPRALNYALQFARGRLLTIFDAEDIPAPNQLRLAAAQFAVASSEVACLQAELSYYNPDESWLTRQFTIEYATLFGLILPALSAHHLPLPLGGTSNHFRTSLLREVGAWDPYNVTEDADLGLRLARFGYETGTLNARTLEEAPVRLANWTRQRARWLKGFLVTWLVHMRAPRKLYRQLGPSAFWAAQAMTIGVYASALLHPLCLAGATALLVLEPGLPPDAGPWAIAFSALNLLVFVTGYAVTMIAVHRAISKLGISGWLVPVLTMPVYWLLISIAAWLALWQFVAAPFYWNKTEHGLSRAQQQLRRQQNSPYTE